MKDKQVQRPISRGKDILIFFKANIFESVFSLFNSGWDIKNNILRPDLQ